ncbi:MAG: hypothetical protein JNM62_15210 [Flavobacteriales bacterium]|nr:hypothetical protein [Flavobacteriales bacterium]
MAKKKAITKKELDAIERAAKREAQKAAGALDGRFRQKVVPNKKRKAEGKKKVNPDAE